MTVRISIISEWWLTRPTRTLTSPRRNRSLPPSWCWCKFQWKFTWLDFWSPREWKSHRTYTSLKDMQQAALEAAAWRANKKPCAAAISKEYKYEKTRVVDVIKLDDYETNCLSDAIMIWQWTCSSQTCGSAEETVGYATRRAMSSGTATQGRLENLNTRAQDPQIVTSKYKWWTPTWRRQLSSVTSVPLPSLQQLHLNF